MEELSLNDYLAILKWRKRYFYITFCIVWAAAFVFALFWSNYRSTAVVGVEQSLVAADATTPMGTNPNDAQEALADLRIAKIKQKVTAPGSLVEIMTKFDLYPSARKYTPLAELTDRMSGKIKLDLVSSTVANPAAAQKVSVDQLSAIAFKLSFDYNSPQIAQQVTNELVTRFLDEDLKQRRAQAQETSAFLEKQIGLLETDLADQEKKIAEFQQVNGISRPETFIFNQQAAAQTSMSIQSLDAQITSNEGTQGAIRAQLASIDPYSRVISDGQVMTTPSIQLKALQSQYSTLTAQYGPEHPDVIKVRHQMEALRKQVKSKTSDNTGSLKAEIEDLKTNIAGAEETYGADHPDVIGLKKQLETKQEELNKKQSGTSPLDALTQDADNPAYLEFVAQLKSSQEQYKSLTKQREALVAQQAKYQAVLTQSPATEQQMQVLTRDHDNAQLRYRQLKEKKMSADMDLQMVEDRKGQRLLVISPPEFPTKTAPSRLVIIFAGLFLAIIGGLATVVATQVINQSVLGAQHLQSITGVPPLITIPHIITEEEAAAIQARRPIVFKIAAAAIFVAILLFNFVIMPFNELLGQIMQKLGLS